MCGSARAKRKFVSDEAIADAARPLRTAVLQPPSTHPLDPPRVLQAIGSASDGSRADRPHDRDPAPAKGASPSSCAFKDLVARACHSPPSPHGWESSRARSFACGSGDGRMWPCDVIDERSRCRQTPNRGVGRCPPAVELRAPRTAHPSAPLNPF
ncbi:hypothetical protein AGIG_G20287 [Arapaima gigas]